MNSTNLLNIHNDTVGINITIEVGVDALTNNVVFYHKVLVKGELVHSDATFNLTEVATNIQTMVKAVTSGAFTFVEDN